MPPKTARSHLEHIYAKTRTTNHVRASLFAVQQGLNELYRVPASS